MLTIKKLTENYDFIVEKLNEYGFKNALLFRGFCEIELHNFNLVVFDRYFSEDEPSSQTLRRLDLKDSLTEKLNIQCSIITPENMEAYYLNKLNENNSVTISKEKDATYFLDQVVNVFGYSWEFNAVCQTYEAFCRETEEQDRQNYYQEMDRLTSKDEIDENANQEITYDTEQQWSNLDQEWLDGNTDFSPAL